MGGDEGAAEPSLVHVDADAAELDDDALVDELLDASEAAEWRRIRDEEGPDAMHAMRVDLAADRL